MQCRIVELENQGRGPHFVNAEREDASAIRSQVTLFSSNCKTFAIVSKLKRWRLQMPGNFLRKLFAGICFWILPSAAHACIYL